MDLIRLNVSRIQELSARRYRSEAEFARAAGWTPRYLNQVLKATMVGEAPGITTTKLNGLCNALGVKVSTILIHDLDPVETA